MRRTLLAALLALTLVQAAASDAFVDGNELLENCTGDGPDMVYCAGFMAALVDTANAVSIAAEDRPMLCIPDGVNTSQITDIVVNYLKARPEDRALSAATLGLLALLDVYAC